MAVNESYNFDDGTQQGWTFTAGANSTVDVDVSAALNGSVEGARLRWDTQNNDNNYLAKTLGTTYTTIYIRFYTKFAAIGQFTNTGHLVQVGQASIFNIQGALETVQAGATPTVWTLREDINGNGVALTVGTEYEIEARWVKHAATGGWQVWVDGSLEIDDLTNDTSGTADIGFLQMVGGMSGNVNSGSYIYIDEIEIDDARIGGAVGANMPLSPLSGPLGGPLAGPLG